MTSEIESSLAAEPEESSKLRKASVWIAGIATLALLVGVVGVVIYCSVARPVWSGFARKTLWAYLDVFLVPVIVAVATGWLTWEQHRRQRKDEAERHAQEARAEEAQMKRELEVEEQRAQDQALEAYLDEISQLLTDEKRPLSRARPGDNLSTVARARTLTVLTRLDAGRKGSVLQFLYESGLVTRGHVVIDLKGADLSNAHLSAANLREVDLSATDLRSARLNAADLGGANLIEAALIEADLSATNLYKADLSGADLLRSDLSAANLSAVNLSEADLSKAHLTGTNLHKANLRRGDLREAFLRAAHLHEADLEGADLEGVHFEGANLEGANLQGATLSNGQKYEEWFKDKEGSGENGENSGPS
jgi:uncharacterized protein YjbI with pentapeptide repeats